MEIYNHLIWEKAFKILKASICEYFPFVLTNLVGLSTKLPLLDVFNPVKDSE